MGLGTSVGDGDGVDALIEVGVPGALEALRLPPAGATADAVAALAGL